MKIGVWVTRQLCLENRILILPDGKEQTHIRLREFADELPTHAAGAGGRGDVGGDGDGEDLRHGRPGEGGD